MYFLFIVYRHSAVNGGIGGVKNIMLNNGSIITGKKYVVQIYKTNRVKTRIKFFPTKVSQGCHNSDGFVNLKITKPFQQNFR